MKEVIKKLLEQLKYEKDFRQRDRIHELIAMLTKTDIEEHI